jgi:hypothetical protein
MKTKKFLLKLKRISILRLLDIRAFIFIYSWGKDFSPVLKAKSWGRSSNEVQTERYNIAKPKLLFSVQLFKINEFFSKVSPPFLNFSLQKMFQKKILISVRKTALLHCDTKSFSYLVTTLPSISLKTWKKCMPHRHLLFDSLC